MSLADTFRRIVADAEAELTHDRDAVEQFVHTEKEELEHMITDALNALSAAKDAILAKIASDAAALTGVQSQLTQAEADRDAAKAQLADAETQITAITAQLSQ